MMGIYLQQIIYEYFFGLRNGVMSSHGHQSTVFSCTMLFSLNSSMHGHVYVRAPIRHNTLGLKSQHKQTSKEVLPQICETFLFFTRKVSGFLALMPLLKKMQVDLHLHHLAPIYTLKRRKTLQENICDQVNDCTAVFVSFP